MIPRGKRSDQGPLSRATGPPRRRDRGATRLEEAEIAHTYTHTYTYIDAPSIAIRARAHVRASARLHAGTHRVQPPQRCGQRSVPQGRQGGHASARLCALRRRGTTKSGANTSKRTVETLHEQGDAQRTRVQDAHERAQERERASEADHELRGILRHRAQGSAEADHGQLVVGAAQRSGRRWRTCMGGRRAHRESERETTTVRRETRKGARYLDN